MKKNGFTLIELLAVIVILAIITLIGATTVFPYIRDSRKRAFLVEVNEAISSAQNAMKLIDVGKIDGSDYSKVSLSTHETYWCFPIEDLVSLGLWTKDAGAVSGDNATYEGWVMVRKGDMESYNYIVAMQNGSYYINNVNSNYIEDKVKNGSDILCSCDIDSKCITLLEPINDPIKPLPGDLERR